MCIRRRDHAGSILNAIRGACDLVGDTEEYPAEDEAAAIWNTFCDVASMMNDEDADISDSTRLSFAQTLIHAGAVAEHSKNIKTQQAGSRTAENLNLREALSKDRSGVINHLRELIRDGLITLDDIDPPPLEIDDLSND